MSSEVVVLLDEIDLEASARIVVFFFLVLKSCEILSLPLAACGISRRDLLIGFSTRSIRRFQCVENRVISKRKNLTGGAP